MQRIFGLDVARAAAIALVLLAHLCVWALEEWPLSQSIRQLLESVSFLSGFLGVELFFVLSGFLVGGIALREFEKEITPASLRHFYQRRWLRTLPAYYVVLMLLIAAYGEAFSVKHLFFLQAFTPQLRDFFSVSWSLCIEEWFYLLLPAFCYFLIYVPAKRRVWAIGAAILAVGLLRAGVWAEFAPAFETMRRFVPIRMDALLIGVWLAALLRYHPRAFEGIKRIGWISLPLVVVAALAVGYRHAHPDALTLLKTYALKPWWFTLCSLNFALLLAWLSGWKKAAGVAAQAVTGMSLLAYSLYLTHNEIFLLLRTQNALAGSWIGPVIGLALAFMVAFVLFKGVEQPFMRLRDKMTDGKTRA